MTFTDKQAPTWALVPLKSPDRAKSRLAAVLDVEQRSRLFFELAQRVIHALRCARGIDAVAVVTSSADVASFALEQGAMPILQSADFGMSAAFDIAIRELQQSNPRRVLMVPGDLPLVSAADIEAVLAAADSNPGIVVVPDRHRIGTNALLCTPAAAIAPCFGGHSFERHLVAAASAGVAARVVEMTSLGLDLDSPDDLHSLRAHGGELADSLFAALQSASSTRDACFQLTSAVG